MRSKTIPAILVCLFCFSILANGADTSQPRMLRVSLVQGDVTYQRTDLDKWVDLSINTPILEGDRIWVGRDGRIELEFEDGSTIRLAENSSVEFTHLGAYSDSSSIQIQLNRGVGSFGVNSQAGPFVVEAPMLTVVVQQSARFRVDVDTDGSSRLVVFDGKTEVQRLVVCEELSRHKGLPRRQDAVAEIGVNPLMLERLGAVKQDVVS